MVFSCFAVYVLANNTRVVSYFESYITASKFDFCVIKKIFVQDHLINPSFKSENPASCLCMIAVFQCVHPTPLRALREVHILENRSHSQVRFPFLPWKYFHSACYKSWQTNKSLVRSIYFVSSRERPYHVLTSRSFLRWEKLYTIMVQIICFDLGHLTFDPMTYDLTLISCAKYLPPM